MNKPLDALIAAVASSAKYRDFAPALIEQVAVQELGKRRNLKEAIKATKNKLHQIAGAYLAEAPNYAGWQQALKECASQGADPRPMLRQWLAVHASTRERLSHLEEFYRLVLAGLPQPQSILDLACGHNPLAVPWMNLAAGSRYFACDIYQSQADFLNEALPILGVQCNAFVCNLLTETPSTVVDLAFLLKTIPCLEQMDKTIGRRLIEQIHADVLIVSFPIRSLGGKDRNMAGNYEAHFHELMEGLPFHYDKILLSNELVFRIFKAIDVERAVSPP